MKSLSEHQLLQERLIKADVSAAVGHTGAVTLVSFNVHFGKRTGSIRQAFAAQPNLREADIILFQEIEHHVLEHESRAERIAADLGFQCLYAPAS